MKVKELKEELREILNDLNKYKDDQKVHMVSNTYFLGDCYIFLGISGYNGGYINLYNPVEKDDEDYEDDEEEY